MKIKNFIFIGIIVLAIILRFWQLGHVPASLDWDEASLGYNAYSILHTRADEYGKVLPVVLKSFGDYKPALYAYLIIPFLLLFNLSAFAVRLPSAIFGVISVVGIYFLVKELFKREDLSLASAFFMAISPWSIQFSRVAFETNVGLTFNIFAALFFIKGLKKWQYLQISAICAALSIYTYQSEKVFTPLLIGILLIIYYRLFFSLKKRYISSFFITGIIIILPMFFYIVTTPNSLSRATSTTIFSQNTDPLQKAAVRLALDRKNNDIFGILIDNRKVIYAKEILANYISHFDPDWLFVTGDIARHHAPDMGLLYLFEIPLVLSGIFYLISLRKSDVSSDRSNLAGKLVIFSFLFLAPIPVAVTADAPHAVRAMNMLPFLVIASGFGVVFLYNLVQKSIKNKSILYGIFAIAALFFFFNFYYYLNQYFVQLNYFNAADWQYGYEQMVPKVAILQNQYQKVIVDNVTPMDQSYIFFLFYSEYSPERYQSFASQNQDSNKQFDNFEFRHINWSQDKALKNTLFVGTQSDFPPTAQVLGKVLYPDGTTAMEMVGAK